MDGVTISPSRAWFFRVPVIVALAVVTLWGCEAPGLGPALLVIEDPVEPRPYRARGLDFETIAHSTARDISDARVIVGEAHDRAVRWELDDIYHAQGPFDLLLPGGEDPGPGSAMGVNEAGHIVGFLTGASIRPFVWTEAGGLRELPLPPGSQAAVAYDVNDSGQIVGSASADPVFADEYDSRVVLWSVDAEGELIDLFDVGALDGTGAKGHAINEAGQIAGVVWYGGGERQASFVWHPVAETESVPLESASLGMNDLGAVVGSFDGRAAVWSGGKLQVVGPRDSFARAINDDFSIVGEAAIDNRSGSQAGFVILDTELHVLEALSLVEYARPFAVNSEGIIVGDSFTEGPDVGKATYWILR